MNIRRALTSAAAGALLLVGAGAGSAEAQTAKPFTGATSCTYTTFNQYTLYHGKICYTNTGYDNLSTSGFLTYQILTGCNIGYFNYYNKQGDLIKNFTFGPEQVKDFTGSDGPISLVFLHIQAITC